MFLLLYDSTEYPLADAHSVGRAAHPSVRCTGRNVSAEVKSLVDLFILLVLMRSDWLATTFLVRTTCLRDHCWAWVKLPKLWSHNRTSEGFLRH